MEDFKFNQNFKDVANDGMKFDTPFQADNYKVAEDEIVENRAESLPVKENMWTKFKAFLFQEIRVELTPKQQEFQDKMNEVLHQEITFKKVHDFLFQEIKFGK